MHTFHAHSDLPRTLVERLRQLNDNLQALGSRLKQSIASIIGTTIAEAVRDAVRALLGAPDAPAERPRNDYHNRWNDSAERSWNEDTNRGWAEEDDFAPPRSQDVPAASSTTTKRWRDALSSALQTAVWWLKYQPCRRPVLTTVAVTLTAGLTAYVAGPALVAGAGILASVAGLLLTADAARSAVQFAAG